MTTAEPPGTSDTVKPPRVPITPVSEGSDKEVERLSGVETEELEDDEGGEELTC